MTDGDAVGLAARRRALVAIAAVDEGAWSTRAVPDAIAALDDVRDRGFAAHLAHETIRWQVTLDWLLAGVLSRPLDDVEPPLRRILRMGALQVWRSNVPARAAVSTSVALAREVVPAGRAKGAGGFVNGVLRGLVRDLPTRVWPDTDSDPVAALSLATGHPRWIVEERIAVLGIDGARSLLDAANEAPGLTLRATGDRDALVTELQALGLDASPTTQSPTGVRVPGADPRRLACVAEGRAVPQDEASMLVVEAAGVTAGDEVLDLCAGPGGKATHLAALAGPHGRVRGVELHQHRADLVTAAAERLGVAMDVVVGDARTVVLDPADVVLVDAPCTGLGTGRRRSEVRHRRTPADVGTLHDLQVELVQHAIGLVRPGGRLTYAVCTWTAGETTDVVAEVEADAGPRLRRISQRQLAPDVDATDGMFHVTWEVVGDVVGEIAAERG